MLWPLQKCSVKTEVRAVLLFCSYNQSIDQFFFDVFVGVQFCIISYLSAQ